MARDRDRPTMQDIADKVGVSKALVSLVFRNAAGPSAETRQRVFAAADELGYRVNRTAALMTARRTHHLGVTINIRNSFHTEIVEHIVAAADRAGYEVVLGAVTPTHGEAKVIETLLDFRCEGILLIGPELSASELASLGGKVPVGRRRTTDPSRDARRRPNRRRPWNRDGRRSPRRTGSPSGGPCLRRLGRHRHRPLQWLPSRDAQARLGTPCQSRSTATSPNQRESLRHNDCWRKNCRLRWCAPTTALPSALLDALRRAGVDVPGEVSVTGYDDSMLARLGHIDLTTVSQKPQEQADHAVAAVIERLDKERTESRSSVLTPQLVVRATTAAPS